MTELPAVDRDTIRETYRVIRPHVRRTPTLRLDARDVGIPDVRAVLKLELFQHSGSFKARGAFSNLLTREVPEAGVVAASGGNHGAAVAFAAQRLGLPARIYVPSIASPAKIDAIRSYGADLVVGGERYIDAFEASEAWRAQSGALSVHAYDSVETMRGAGTIALEIEEDVEDVDTVLVAVGGGGQIGGIAAYFAGGARVIGVEPEGAPTLFRAREAGRPVDAEMGSIAADSLAPRRIGELTFPIAQQYVHDVVLVGDSDIRAAQETLWRVARIVAEPGGAAAFAALVSGAYTPHAGEKVVVVVCGANTTAVRF